MPPVPKRVAAVPPVPDRAAVFPPHVRPRPRRSLKIPLFAPQAHKRTEPRPMHRHPPTGLFNRKATVLDSRPPIRIAPPKRPRHPPACRRIDDPAQKRSVIVKKKSAARPPHLFSFPFSLRFHYLSDGNPQTITPNEKTFRAAFGRDAVPRHYRRAERPDDPMA